MHKKFFSGLLILLSNSAFAGQSTIIVGESQALMTLSRSSAVITLQNAKLEEIVTDLDPNGVVSIEGIGDVKIDNISSQTPFAQGLLNGKTPVVLIPQAIKTP